MLSCTVYSTVHVLLLWRNAINICSCSCKLTIDSPFPLVGTVHTNTQVPSMSAGRAECCGAGHRTHLLQPAQEDLLQVRLRGVLGATRARRRRMLPPATPSHSAAAPQSALLNAVTSVTTVSQSVRVTRGWWSTVFTYIVINNPLCNLRTCGVYEYIMYE